jgi:hypothetical protein
VIFLPRLNQISGELRHPERRREKSAGFAFQRPEPQSKDLTPDDSKRSTSSHASRHIFLRILNLTQPRSFDFGLGELPAKGELDSSPPLRMTGLRESYRPAKETDLILRQAQDDGNFDPPLFPNSVNSVPISAS